MVVQKFTVWIYFNDDYESYLNEEEPIEYTFDSQDRMDYFIMGINEACSQTNTSYRIFRSHEDLNKFKEEAEKYYELMYKRILELKEHK
jgi:hypothetical protein